MTKLLLGFDPGGQGSFGCAVYDPDLASLHCTTVGYVDEAVDWTRKKMAALGKRPSAAGIDTLLFWQTTPLLADNTGRLARCG